MRRYYRATDGIVFVVDVTDVERIGVVREEVRADGMGLGPQWGGRLFVVMGLSRFAPDRSSPCCLPLCLCMELV